MKNLIAIISLACCLAIIVLGIIAVDQEITKTKMLALERFNDMYTFNEPVQEKPYYNELWQDDDTSWYLIYS